MKAEVIKNIIIRASLKQVGEIIEITEKDLKKYQNFLIEITDEGIFEDRGVQKTNEPSKKQLTKKK